MLNPDPDPFPVLASLVEGSHVVTTDYAESFLQGEVSSNSNSKCVNSH